MFGGALLTSVCFRWSPSVNVYGRAHGGSVCGFSFSGFRSPLSHLLCFITMLVVMYVFHCDVPQMRQRASMCFI